MVLLYNSITGASGEAFLSASYTTRHVGADKHLPKNSIGLVPPTKTEEFPYHHLEYLILKIFTIYIPYILNILHPISYNKINCKKKLLM